MIDYQVVLYNEGVGKKILVDLICPNAEINPLYIDEKVVKLLNSGKQKIKNGREWEISEIEKALKSYTDYVAGKVKSFGISSKVTATIFCSLSYYEQGGLRKLMEFFGEFDLQVFGEKK